MALLADKEVSGLRRIQTFLSPLGEALNVVIAILVTCFCLVILTPSILCLLSEQKSQRRFSQDNDLSLAP